MPWFGRQCLGAVSVLLLFATVLRAADAGGAASMPAGKVAVGLYGNCDGLAGLLADPRYNLVRLTSLDTARLDSLRVLVVHDLSCNASEKAKLARGLVDFVQRGGGLFLTGAAVSALGSPFPDAVVGCREVAQSKAGGTVDDLMMKVTDGRWIIEEFTGETFQASTSAHHVFQAGPAGSTVVLDRFDWPVVVGATFGGGKVIFAGCDYARVGTSDKEAEVTRTLLAYLAGFAGGPRK